MSNNGEQRLITDGVTSGYGSVVIIEEISIRVGSSEIVTIIGPNGAGKSTLIKAVFGLLPTWSGSVLFEGTDISNTSPDDCVHRGIGYVPQTENVFPTLTVRENLEMGAFLLSSGIEDRISWVFDLFPVLKERPRERAGRLSGGQRQQLAIGRALMLEPKLLLLDEPSASLSPIMVQVVFEKIIEINQLGTSMLLVEQNARNALEISDRGYVLAGGRKRLEGPAQEILDSDEVRRLYLGE